jgi:hypothetical protein
VRRASFTADALLVVAVVAGAVDVDEAAVVTVDAAVELPSLEHPPSRARAVSEIEAMVLVVLTAVDGSRQP